MSNEITPLQLAAEDGEHSAAEALASEGEDIDRWAHDGIPALDLGPGEERRP